MFFQNDKPPYIIINNKTYLIKHISSNFYSHIKLDIKNSIFYYIRNASFKEALQKNELKLPIMNIESNEKIYYCKCNPIYKKNETILYVNDVSDLIEEIGIHKQNINSLVGQLKEKKLFLQGHYDVLNTIEFFFCIFNEEEILFKNSYFKNVFGDINHVNSLFNENFYEIIYQLKLKMTLKHSIINYNNVFYEIFISKHGQKYHLLGHNANKQFLNEIELKRNYETIINIIGHAVHKKSEFTSLHIQKVREITKLLATLYKKHYNVLLDEDIELISLASVVHDIGKLEIESEILEKQGKLTDEEMSLMKKHTVYGKELIDKYTPNLEQQSKLMKICAIVAHEHHEKWDGTGYPMGKVKSETHLYSRIVALADIMEALMAVRPYKKAWTDEDLISFLRKEKEKTFDPNLVDLVLNNYELFRNLRNTNTMEVKNE